MALQTNRLLASLHDIKEIDKNLTNIENAKKEILRAYLNLFIKNHHPKVAHSEKDYPLNRFLEKVLIKKIIKLDQEKQALIAKKNEFLRISLLSNQTYSQAINPISEKPLNLGEHTLSLTPPCIIKAPIGGTITNLKYSPEGIMVKIENERCSAVLFPLSSLRLDLGQKVVIKEILGEVKDHSYLRVKIYCSVK